MSTPDQKPVSEMTAAEARKLIASAVANGVLMAGLVLLLVHFVLGFVAGAISSSGS